MNIHPSLTEGRIVRAVRKDNGSGFCVRCGRQAKHFCEPDLNGVPCHFKGCAAEGSAVGTVYGAEQLLLMTVF